MILKLLLFLFSITLAGLAISISIIWTVIRSIFNGGLGTYFYWFSFSIDQLGNVACQHLFNDLWIKPDGHRMGNPDETISFVLGTNKKNGTLYPFGRGMANAVDFVAWLMGDGRDHCLRAAENSQSN